MYLGLTSGVMVNIHYCMGEIAEVNYGHPDDENCNSCGMKEVDGCCHTDHKFIKSDVDHLTAKNTAELNPWIAELPLLYLNDVIFSYTSPDLKDTQYLSPPDQRNNDVCMYNCVFRI